MWLVIVIFAYFLFAVVSLFDRYILVGPVPEPKIYTFWVGTLGFLIALLLFAFGVTIPETNLILIGLVSGILRVFGTLFLYKAIAKTEVSRAVPAMNGLLPIFSFLIFFLYFPKTEILNLVQATAFILLVTGSVLISFKKGLGIFSVKNLRYPAISALFFSLNFFLTKNLFLKVDFISGLFLVLLGVGLGALSLFLSSGFRKMLFDQKITLKVSGIIFLGQILGALGVLCQFYAIFLVKPGQVPLVNALEGTRDVFLLLFVFILFQIKPKLLKEKMAGAIGWQKALAVLLIVAGLAILALK